MDEVMPSRRQSSAMLSSPRKPSSTMRILSSAAKCRRVARRMSFTTCSAGALSGPDFCFIFAPDGYDDPEILRSRKPAMCLTGADAAQLAGVCRLRVRLRIDLLACGLRNRPDGEEV